MSQVTNGEKMNELIDLLETKKLNLEDARQELQETRNALLQHERDYIQQLQSRVRSKVDYEYFSCWRQF